MARVGAIPVDDPDDPRVEVFLGLRDHHARQLREAPGGDLAGQFIVEGDRVIERALAAGERPAAVLVAERRRRPLPAALGDTPVFAAADAVLQAITGRPELRDPIASFVRRPLPDPAELVARHRYFAVLEGINNPNNLGVIMRNAAGLGVDAVLLDPTCGDPLYRRAIRASMGQVFAIPHARLASFPGGLDLLHEAGVTTVALSPSAPSELADVDIDASKAAVLLGAEGPGLTTAVVEAATRRVRIPMRAGVDSLNVASAAAIAFHHYFGTHG